MAGAIFIPAAQADAEQLFRWRRAPHVAHRMTGDAPVNMASHRAWLEQQLQRTDIGYWIIHLMGAPAGLLNVRRLDGDQKTADWGFYIGASKALGLGAMVPLQLYNALFLDVEIDCLCADVIKSNREVQDLHLKHGYDRVPEKDRSLNGKTLYHFRLRRSRWTAMVRYHRLSGTFPGLKTLWPEN